VEPVEELEEADSAEEADVERCGRAAGGGAFWPPRLPPMAWTREPMAPANVVLRPAGLPPPFSCSTAPFSSPPLPSEAEPEPEPEPDPSSDPSPPRASSCLISPALKTMNPASGLEPSPLLLLLLLLLPLLLLPLWLPCLPPPASPSPAP
jgi:hypothetical protein